MTKKEICDTVRNVIGWQHDRRQVAAVISTIYSMYISDAMDRRVKNFEFLSKEYTDQTVSDDDEGDYVTLPAAIVGLPTATDGVVSVRNAGSGDLDYFPMSEKDRMLSEGLDSDTINTFTGYYVVGNKIRLYNHSSSVSTVDLVLAIQFYDFAWTDEVNLPGGRDFNIIDLAINRLLNAPPEPLKTE